MSVEPSLGLLPCLVRVGCVQYRGLLCLLLMPKQCFLNFALRIQLVVLQ